MVGATIIGGIGVACGLANDAYKFAIAWVALVLFLWLLIKTIFWLCCWRNFKRFLFGLACLATLIALFYAEEDWRGWHAWNSFKHEWEAKGEHFDYASIIPPAVPDDQNFAMQPIWIESMEAGYGSNVTWQWYGKKLTAQEQARLVDRLHMPLTENDAHGPTNSRGNWPKATLPDLTSWQNYYRALATKTNLFPVVPQPQTPAQDVLLALSKYNPAIEELRQASLLPYARFPLYSNADHPFDTLLPHLAALKACAQVLELRTIAELQNGQSEKALADVKLSLRLADAIRTEPFLISHLVRIAILQITLQPVYEGLAEHKWSDAQLVDLDAELAKLDFLSDFKLALRGERSCAVTAVEFIRHRNLRHFNEIFDMSGNGGRPQMSVGAILYYLCPNGWFYQNELRVSRFLVKWDLPLVNEAEQTVSPASLHAADRALDMEFRHRTPENYLEAWLLPSLGGAAKKFAYAQASVDLARTAIALERYRLAHGEYPESLAALAPQFIAQVPHDVIGGSPLPGSGAASQPLKYRRTGDGQFVLYSVGWNEKDDGGVVIFTKGSTPDVDRDQGDWVWRYPAKVE